VVCLAVVFRAPAARLIVDAVDIPKGAAMKDLLATLLKVFEPSEPARRELSEARRDLPKLYGRNWSDRGHF
jgi:hypothetical protein